MVSLLVEQVSGAVEGAGAVDAWGEADGVQHQSPA